jgi:hypothetical protein
VARYSYECPTCGEIDKFFPMGKAPEAVLCFHPHETRSGGDVKTAQRVYSFNFQEDRRRMRQGTSPATGKPYAQSRQQERLIEQATGVHFASKADLLPHERAAIAYNEHVATGGERVENAVSVPQEKSLPLTHYMKEANYRRHEFPAETFTQEHQSRQLKELVAKAETA